MELTYQISSLTQGTSTARIFHHKREKEIGVGISSILEEFCACSSRRAEIIVVTVSVELRSLSARRIIGSQVAGVKCWHLIAKCKVVMVTVMDSGVKAVIIIV